MKKMKNEGENETMKKIELTMKQSISTFQYINNI